LQVEPKVQKLYDYIRERGTILPINDYSQELLSQDDVHKRVAESIRSGEPLHLTSVMTLHPCNALGVGTSSSCMCHLRLLKLHMVAHGSEPHLSCRCNAFQIGGQLLTKCCVSLAD